MKLILNKKLNKHKAGSCTYLVIDSIANLNHHRCSLKTLECKTITIKSANKLLPARNEILCKQH